jgi:hypothetical protein
MAFIQSDDTVNIADLVGPLMLDCPVPIASQGILWAAIEFCRRTLIYANKTTITVTNQNDIALYSTDDAILSDIDSVYWTPGSTPTKPILLDPWTREEAAEWLAREPIGIPKGYFRPSPNTLRLVPPPAAAGSLEINLILTPTRNATTLPSFLYDNCWEAIEHGANYKLMSLRNRPWSDPSMAEFHRGQFEILIGSFGAIAVKDGTRKKLRSTPDFTVGHPNWNAARRMNYWRG